MATVMVLALALWAILVSSVTAGKCVTAPGKDDSQPRRGSITINFYHIVRSLVHVLLSLLIIIPEPEKRYAERSICSVSRGVDTANIRVFLMENGDVADIIGWLIAQGVNPCDAIHGAKAAILNIKMNKLKLGLPAIVDLKDDLIDAIRYGQSAVIRANAARWAACNPVRRIKVYIYIRLP